MRYSIFSIAILCNIHFNSFAEEQTGCVNTSQQEAHKHLKHFSDLSILTKPDFYGFTINSYKLKCTGNQIMRTSNVSDTEGSNDYNTVEELYEIINENTLKFTSAKLYLNTTPNKVFQSLDVDLLHIFEESSNENLTIRRLHQGQGESISVTSDEGLPQAFEDTFSEDESLLTLKCRLGKTKNEAEIQFGHGKSYNVIQAIEVLKEAPNNATGVTSITFFSDIEELIRFRKDEVKGYTVKVDDVSNDMKVYFETDSAIGNNLYCKGKNN